MGPVADVARPHLERGVLHGLAVAPLPGAAGGEAERVVGVVADEGDALVPEVDQVAGGQAPALDVIGDDRGHPGAVAVQQDHGHARVGQPDQAPRGRGQRHDEQAVGPVPAGEGGEVLVAVHRGLDVEQHEVVAAAVQRGHHPPQALDGRGVGEEGHDHAQGLAAAPGQAPGQRVGPVVEQLDGGEHPGAGALADPGAVVQHPGHGAGAHARMCCDVRDRDHRPPFPVVATWSVEPLPRTLNAT